MTGDGTGRAQRRGRRWELERLHEGPASETRYLGSVAYFPELYGAYAVAALIDILDGRAVPQEIHIDHVWVNRDNVDQYYALPHPHPRPQRAGGWSVGCSGWSVYVECGRFGVCDAGSCWGDFGCVAA